MNTFKHLALVMLFTLCSSTAFAQLNKNNIFNPVTTSVTSLSIAPDARAGGMGDIGAATDPDVSSQYWNVAKYPFTISRAGVSLNYTPWLRKLVNDMNLANLVGYYRIGEHAAVSSSLRYFSLGEVNTRKWYYNKSLRNVFRCGLLSYALREILYRCCHSLYLL